MLRLSSALILSSVFLIACKKDKAEPEILLEGRWQPRTTRDYSYDAAGKLINQGSGALPSYYYLLITQDSLLYRDVNDNSSWGSYKLIRQGNSLQFLRDYDCQITQLTSNKLVLRFQKASLAPNTAYSEQEDEYSR